MPVALSIALATLSAPPAIDEAWWPTALPSRTATPLNETAEQHDLRMAWWREARFGMFIHWGLYAIPSGHWNGRKTGGAEWILNTAQIHPDDYMPLQQQFNPVDFDATQWAMIARDAGMRYMVITSKHHDGFCLWPSEFTEFDVEGTPFKRDIMGELAEACRNEDIVFCMYHSIMDWTHPDYLPRRAWDDRPTDDVDFDRYVGYMRNQLGELVENYGPGVLWFDGEWEGTWTHEHGQAMYDHVRTLDPKIIVNNRVDTGRTGMAGLTREGGYRGDFGTPEQQIPATGMPPGVDWETCMTMNRSWGYQSFDTAFKSTSDLVRKLVDIASKGGNFLLNVGPDARGRFPRESIDRLAGMGDWMRVNGRSIHGTHATCFPNLPWGRCTRRTLPAGNERLYLHVFERPASGTLVLDGLMNEPLDGGAYLLANPGAGALDVRREGASLVVALPGKIDDPIDTVITLDIVGSALVVGAPTFAPDKGTIFVDSLAVQINTPSDEVDIRFTIDGSDPTATSDRYTKPIVLQDNATLLAKCFLDDQPVSTTSRGEYRKVVPLPAVQTLSQRPGLNVQVYLGDFDALPDFNDLEPDSETASDRIDLSAQPRPEHFAIRFTGFIDAPETGIYTFWLDSDDGSLLRIGDVTVVDNDGLHSAIEKSGSIALASGLHPITIEYFEKTGQDDLELEWAGPKMTRAAIPPARLVR
ncbi:MAG: alpha-L-fucosidase [Phycisphaerales bacterium]|nr:alpha-L-fucosidase [Phycisphaerales bacterium]